MPDSYQVFLSYFGISLDELIRFGLEQTVYPDDHAVGVEWERAKLRLVNKQTHWIRGAGRNASGTTLFQLFYKRVLGVDVLQDPTNNSEPRKVLRKISPTRGRDLINYQVSHIFGRTKNPLLFTAPWNIVWKPKVLDPFTGHEAKGSVASAYKRSFFEDVIKRYRNYILDYEALRAKYFAADIVNDCILSMDNDFLFSTNEHKQRFIKSVVYETGCIQILD